MCLRDGNRVEAYCFAGFSTGDNIQAPCEHADGDRSITLIKFHGQNVVARRKHAVWYKGRSGSGCVVHNHSPHPNQSRTARTNYAWGTLLFDSCGRSMPIVS
jgi:hypothetical protein